MNKAKISRAQILTFGLFVILAIFAVRLFDIQVVQHDQYLAKANAMQTTKETINPVRGQIYVRDADGTLAPLVLNQTVYTLFADPTQITDVTAVKNLVNQVAGGQVIDGSFARLTDKSTEYVVLAKQISYDQAQEIQKANLAGLGLQAGTERVYPEGALASQVLGFVNADGQGQYGVEQDLNSELAGKPGLLQSVTDVRQIPLTIGAHDISIPATNGTNIVLTLDRSVQSQAEQTLASGLKAVGSSNGSMIVLDATNGHVLAMANYPSYDVSNYQNVTDASVFQNAVVSYSFEPGSVFKTLTTAMSLDLGKITPDTTYTNNYCVQIGDANICNASGDQIYDGVKTMTQVLEDSLNTGVVWQMQNLGGTVGTNTISQSAQQTMYDYFANHFRFGQLTGIQQAGEAAGTIFTPASVYYDPVRFANMSFGQGIDVTMVQFASAFASAVNGGVYYQPTLLDGTVNADGTENVTKPTVLNPHTISQTASYTLRDMIYTARQMSGKGAADGGYYVGSKTGTAQVYDPTTGTYSTTKTIGTMVGFLADKDHNVKYVIMVRANDDDPNTGFAGTTAANPIFSSMALWLNQYEGVSK